MDPHSHSAPPAFSSLPLLLQTKLFSLLSPRTLAVCACVSRGWSELVAEQAWREAFAALWPPPLAAAAAEPALDWQRSYAARQSAARCWLGRPSTDKLIAHRTAVKACCLLPGHDLLITGATLVKAGSCGGPLDFRLLPPLPLRLLRSSDLYLANQPLAVCELPLKQPFAARAVPPNHPHGMCVPAGGVDRTVRAWDLQSGVQLACRRVLSREWQAAGEQQKVGWFGVWQQLP